MVKVFQSPSGVLGVCRTSTGGLGTTAPDGRFQSPSGVLGVCRDEVVDPSEYTDGRCFSPLPGF